MIGITSNRILLTGASGFVGQKLLAHLVTANLSVVAPSRRPFAVPSAGVANPIIPTINRHTDWRESLAGVEVVVHCASRVHVMTETESDPLAAFRRINVEGAENLARQAAAAGVRRFIFLSSIKVNGEETPPEHPFTADDLPQATDPYGQSKLEAEFELRKIAAETGLEVVIIRPPLVYGPGVKANFLTMMRWIDKGIPLPLGAICNQRSMVGIDNLISLIRVCIDHPAAANQIFLAADGEDVSTPQLLTMIGEALGRPTRLIAVPLSWLLLGARLFSRQAMISRLCGSLQVDIAKNQAVLGWRPPVPVSQGLKTTARHYLGLD